MLEQVLWELINRDVSSVVRMLLPAILVGLCLYNGDYALLVLRAGYQAMVGGGRKVSLSPENSLPAVMVVPTLLRSNNDLEGIVSACESVYNNAYPGELLLVISIDDRTAHPDLFRELERSIKTPPASVRVEVIGTSKRVGKAMAIDHAMRHVERLVERGELSRFPDIFFNMDADSELGPQALERMVEQLTRTRAFGHRATIVASNVVVPPSHYRRRLRDLLTLEGCVAASVAREYLQSISVAKSNLRVLPTITVSGALYCTWSYFPLAAPRFMAYVRTLGKREICRFFLGLGRPSFAACTAPPLPEALTGPGDDTCMSWIALLGRNQHGVCSLELPDSPLAALVESLRWWTFRPLAYDPRAKIYTKTPTKIRSLYKQRIRWNGSRPFIVGGLLPVFFFHFGLGCSVFAQIVLVTWVNAMVVGSALALFMPGIWGSVLHIAIFAFAYSTLMRIFATILGIVLSDEPAAWPTLVVIPLAQLYHFYINIVTGLVAWVDDILLFGTKTDFAPEETLRKTGVPRLALAYRMRRTLLLACRAVRHGDVPFGAFWFGWWATPYTPDGYAGWTSGQKPPPVYPSDKSACAQGAKA